MSAAENGGRMIWKKAQDQRSKELDRPATRDELAGLATKWGGKLF